MNKFVNYTLGTACLMLCQNQIGYAEKSHRLPNVVYIYADDMGKGMISAYGQQMFSTLNIDALVKEGISFNNAYGCMLSAPSRASLLTGYHDCHGDKWYVSPGGEMIPYQQDGEIARVEENINKRDILLPEGDLYLPQVFKKAGYITAQIGKLGWGFTATRKQMQAHGWDYYYGYLDHVACHGYYPPYLFDNGKIEVIEGNTLRNGGKSVEGETETTYRERWNRNGKAVYSQDVFREKIRQFIRENKNRPFFLFHPSQLPHGPVAIPAVHPELAANPVLTPIEKEYASMVKMLDEDLGVIRDELRKAGIEDNTLIVFAADNGHELYYSQKGRCEKPARDIKTGKLFDNYTSKYYSDLAGDVFNGNAGMAGLKRSNLEGGVHIPLIMYWKGKIKPGTVCEQLVANYDFLPTMADLLGIELETEKDGKSMLPLMKGKSKKEIHSYVIFGSNYGPGLVTSDGWKLRQYRAKNVFELYYLPDDPQERKDLSAQYPEKVDLLKALLLKECNGDLKNGINWAG